MTLLRCIRCGTARQSPPVVLPGVPVPCLNCGHNLLIIAALDSLGMHGLMRMGDDDEGGGGGGGGDDSEDDSDKSEDEDDDEDEEDGKGGKKKKKAKAQGGFFANCLSSIIFYLIGGALLLGCCGCVILGQFLGFFKMTPTTPPNTAFVGSWEKKDAGNNVEFKLTLLAANTGTFVDKKGEQHAFKWKAIDNNTVEFEMDSPAKSKFWNDQSKSRFTHAVSGNDLTLTPTGGQAMRFTKASADASADKKDNSDSKDDDKKKKTTK